ncbi:hypothetical protein PVK06_020739 [Gossypium arboreum]|uniref:Uncharacterized protein n=1 Tax=Gossypium arboreum TaxID=29729 RepID=A0ABR0PNJ2_GOSAR|nr:hypothetical protein PVK06_020739 [Gossypium arboreum]
MISMLRKQYENFCTAKEIMTNLEDLFRSQVALARKSIITNLMNFQQKPDTPIKEHMLKLMGFFAETEDNGVELDMNTQIEIMLKSLTKEFSCFRAAYILRILAQLKQDYNF